ncbi:hypothetical protein Tco_0985742 [Tanacetum coccineum]
MFDGEVCEARHSESDCSCWICDWLRACAIALRRRESRLQSDDIGAPDGKLEEERRREYRERKERKAREREGKKRKSLLEDIPKLKEFKIKCLCYQNEEQRKEEGLKAKFL